MAKISIHLVTWNGQRYIADCLESIYRQTYDDYFLLVIDNGSIDDTVRIIEQHYLPLFGDKMRLVKNRENVGFAKGHNQALLWTDSPYVLALNQDIILEPEYLEEAARHLTSRAKIGAISGKLLRWDDKTDELTKGKKSDIVDTLGLSITKAQRVSELGVGEHDSEAFAEEQELFGVSGAAPVYNRRALEDIRYKDEFFDADFISYKEDVDVAYRLRWRGWKSLYIPTMLAYHDRTAPGKKRAFGVQDFNLRRKKSKFINYYSYRNHLLMLYKNLSWGILLRYCVFIMPYEMGKFFYVLFFETKNLRLFLDLWKLRKKMKQKRAFIQGQRICSTDELRSWFI